MKTNDLLKAEMVNIFSSEIDNWLANGYQSNEGFEYEASFVETLREVGAKAFQASLGKVPKSKNQKKTPNLNGRH
ncbi:hypothetical protein AGMMS49982_00740 [Bacteroidia bacterium]|nr:hypothetical protein AGMMS49982_00740 [Bacteroidia bacterium]